MRPRWMAPVLLVALGSMALACSGGGDEAEPTTSEATSTTEDVGAYCRVMERTDVAYRDEAINPTSLAALMDAEAQRIEEAPAELADEYAAFGDAEPGVPNEVVARIQDWTQEHCGFLPSFG